MSGRRLGLPAALLLAGAALLAHANGIPGGFTYDDKAIVRDNPRIRAPSSLPLLFSTQYFGGPPGSGTAYRPVLLVSFAVEWWIHGGDATAFRAVNVLLHVAATLLLARFLLELSSAARSPSARRSSSRCTRSTSRPSPASSGAGRHRPRR